MIPLRQALLHRERPPRMNSPVDEVVGHIGMKCGVRVAIVGSRTRGSEMTSRMDS